MYTPPQFKPDRAASLVQQLGRHVEERRVPTTLREQLSDPAPHRSGAHHRDAAHAVSHPGHDLMPRPRTRSVPTRSATVAVPAGATVPNTWSQPICGSAHWFG